MIPSFVAGIADAFASLFGFDTYVSATAGSRFVRAIHFIRRRPDSQRLRVMRPYDGRPLAAA